MAIKWLDQLVSIINSKVVAWINKSLYELKENIIEKTPIDTWDLAWNNVIRPAKIIWDTVVGKIINETPYARDVETWFDDTKVFDYHKRQWWTRNIYYKAGQDTPGHLWARMYTRAFDELKDKIVLNIKNA